MNKKKETVQMWNILQIINIITDIGLLSLANLQKH